MYHPITPINFSDKKIPCDILPPLKNSKKNSDLKADEISNYNLHLLGGFISLPYFPGLWCLYKTR